MSLKTVSRIENHGNFERTTLEALAGALGEPLEHLERFRPGVALVEEMAGLPVRHFVSYRRESPTDGDVARLIRDAYAGYNPGDIPLITEAQAGDRPIVYDDAASLQAYAERRVPRPEGVSDPLAFAVMVKGDSMLPTFRPGRYVVVSPNVTVAQGDEVFVALTSGARLIKTAHRADGGFMLASANPAYAPRFVKAEDVQVMYPVVWAQWKEG